MEDINKSRMFLILLSCAVIFVYCGLATLSDTPFPSIIGLKIRYIALPAIITVVWLFSWQRFFVLSLNADKSKIDELILAEVNKNNINYKIFPPKNYGLGKITTVVKWSMPDARIPREAVHNYIYYGRTLLKRTFMFSYLGSLENGDASYVHFAEKKANIFSGILTPLSFKYWSCLFFEIKFLFCKSFLIPVVGAYYFPHILSWAAFLVIVFSIIFQ